MPDREGSVQAFPRMQQRVHFGQGSAHRGARMNVPRSTGR